MSASQGVLPSANLPSSGISKTNRCEPPSSAWFAGLFAVLIFSLTAPLTVVALDVFSPAFIAFMRAFIAGIGSISLVLWFKWPLPSLKDIVWLLVGGSCIALVFPYTLAKSLQVWQASDMGVVLAGIPLFTALMAVGLFKEKTSIKFWVSLLVGTQVLVLFAYSQSNGVLHSALFIMLASAGVGYAIGGHVAKRLGGFQTICWMMVLYFPVSLFGVGYTAAENAHGFDMQYIGPLLALLYLAVFSQWVGFRYWYGAMVQIGIAKTGQLQLTQPFMTLIFTVPLLGASLSLVHFYFAALISLTVWWVRKSR
ncbi:MAG: DMT family transporter [Bermanella sp.]|tara:strand:- start:211 stop:1140 length:930 start_codon:yes stop_codon:yes gene_type:complete